MWIKSATLWDEDATFPWVWEEGGSVICRSVFGSLSSDTMKKTVKPSNCPLCRRDLWLALFFKDALPKLGLMWFAEVFIKNCIFIPSKPFIYFYLCSYELSHGGEGLKSFKYFRLPAFLCGLSREPVLFLSLQSCPVLSSTPHWMSLKCCLITDFVGPRGIYL